MATSLVPRATWLGSAALSVMRAFRLVNVIEEPQEENYSAGSDYATGVPQRPRYDARRAMSALPANPWLAAAVNARASDLAGLPLRVTVNGEQVEGQTEDEILALFGRRLRMQVTADYDLSGNAFLLALRGFGAPSKVTRLHPARVDIVPSPTGDAGAYQYRGAGEGVATYLPGDVQHIRGISWEDDPAGLWGQGAVQTLDSDIVADRAIADASARAASKGRPDAVYRPASDKVTWNARQTAEMARQVEQMMTAKDGGVAILSGMGVLEVLGWSPREMEGVAQRHWTRETILARLGVPGTRVGLPDANYATALAQLGIYWTNLQATAALIDEAFSAIAAMHTDGAAVHHDFSQVPALQAMQTEALGRVETHIRNGMPAPLAYRYEGFDDVADDWFVLPAEDSPAPAPVEDETEPTAPGLSVVPSASLSEAVEELASALAILTDDDSDAEDMADAMVSLRQALDALESEQGSRRRSVA